MFLYSTRGTRTVGWIQGPWSTPEEWYEAGRMFMRFWLELTRNGLYLQPYGSVITNPTAHALMTDKLEVDKSQGEVWLLLRLGYCPPPPRSLVPPAVGSDCSGIGRDRSAQALAHRTVAAARAESAR